MSSQAPGRRKAARPPAVHPFDLAYGTETSGLLPGEVIAEGTGLEARELTAYYGVAPSLLETLLDRWLREFTPGAPITQTVFLDVGAGKGRAMMVASRYPFLRVDGVELNPALAAAARGNLAIWDAQDTGALSPIQLYEGDATRFPFGPEPTLVHLFHPFESRLMRRFLRHAVASVRQHPRPFDLLYVNAELDPVLDREPGVQRLWLGPVPMSAPDHAADLAAIAEQEEYGSTGDEICGIYRISVA